MKKIIFCLFALYLKTAIAGNFECMPLTGIEWHELSDGVSWTKYDLAFTPYQKEQHQWTEVKTRSVTVRAFKIDYTKNKLNFHAAKTDLSCSPGKDRYIKRLIDDNGKKIIGAINSNFFVMPNGSIQGIAIDEEKSWSVSLNSQTITSSGVLSIENGQPSLATKDNFMMRFGSVISASDVAKISFAVQAYPKLLIDNVLHITDGVLDSKRSRTSIGFAENPDEIILVTIDARGENDKTGMSLFEFAHFVNKSTCGVGQRTVLNLDGGGSTSFAIPSLGIYEQADKCRHLGNILTIQSR
jgi:uncharacterized protein YigE (DUF2233 family)